MKQDCDAENFSCLNEDFESLFLHENERKINGEQVLLMDIIVKAKN